ncbi:hypothetical protein [Halarchaeum nitratireducens]|uniref:Uncharacterized protein n=1 Tax=Halarchaeum nitratireducens TaxID=489913 RepID=A0A830GF53_9EURY|nr:hypothetical protein [Halarchaeum nitratireducens]GGN27031.1 hypothetical protein GCM10009021_31960 [Halarchaeum nitratireducens]
MSARRAPDLNIYTPAHQLKLYPNGTLHVRWWKKSATYSARFIRREGDYRLLTYRKDDEDVADREDLSLDRLPDTIVSAIEARGFTLHGGHA